MAGLPAFLRRHTVVIEAYEGTNSLGERLYATAVTVLGFVDETRQLVRAATGEEVTAEATVIVPLETVCPPDSRVTLPTGRAARALIAKRRDGGGLPTPDHLEIATT